MCSIITIRTETSRLVNDFQNVVLANGLTDRTLNIRCHGFLKKEMAPVVFSSATGQLTVQMKYFSLCPPWAKEWPFQYSTYNARLSRPKKSVAPIAEEPLFHDEPRVQELEWISEVPSFKDAFCRGQTCLVPISDAIESCYFGHRAGSVVRFSNASDSQFYALGLWNDWIDLVTGEVRPTFTLLTDDPDDFVFSSGHDRGLILLHPSDWNSWLSKKMMPHERIAFIRSRRVLPKWNVESERPLKQGWQKHTPTQHEIARIQVFKGSKVS